MLVAFCGALFSAWVGVRWAPSWIAAALFAVSGAVVGLLALRPVIEIHAAHLTVGKMAIPWLEIQSVDQTGWNAPLALFLTIRGDHRILIFYAGDQESCGSLLRHIQRFSRAALLDGIPHREFWGEAPAGPPKRPASAAPAGMEPDGSPETGKLRQAIRTDAPARYPLLCPEDEEEVERMFQRLKSVGHLESKDSDEK
ncbi:MAG: hypothetical protein EXQ47_08670 [Bryobacterales bacterium]|nr:hypothetical protein [Bryobacterales bacterium]